MILLRLKKHIDRYMLLYYSLVGIIDHLLFVYIIIMDIKFIYQLNIQYE